MSLRSRTDRALDAFTNAGPDDHYVVRVDAGRLDVERTTDRLNEIWALGWQLREAFEQSGNTVMIFERRAS